jgi:WD40 repeat protein
MSGGRTLSVLVVGVLLGRGSVLATPPDGPGKPRVDAAGDALPEGAVARLGTLRLRHEGETFVAFSPDGKQLMSLGADSALHVWSPADGRKVRSFRPPGVKFAVGRNKVNELVEARVLLEQGWAAGPAAHSADGRWLACARPKGGVSVWDTLSGMQPQRLGGRPVLALAFSADARLLAACELDGDVFPIAVWDRQAGREVFRLKPHAAPQALFFSPEGKYLAAREPHAVCLWSTASGKRVRTYPAQDIVDAAFSPDGKYVAAVTGGKTAVVWETASEDEVGTFTLADHALGATCFSADGSSLLTWSDDGLFRLWDWRRGLERRSWQGPASVPALALAPDGKTLAAATAEGIITLWDVVAGKEVGPARAPEVRALAFTRPDTLFLYTAEGEARWVAWAGGKVRRRTARPSPKGAPYAFDAPAKIQVWNEEDHLTFVAAQSGKELAKVQGVEAVTALALAADGRLMALARNDGIVGLWNLPAGQETRRLAVGPATRLAFSHDGKVVAVLGADKELHLWELTSGERRCQFPATQSEVAVLTFTPDDRHLVAACGDECVRVWDVLTGKRVRSLVGHFGPVEALAVSPDGRRLATGGADGLVCVWELGSGAPRRRLEGHRAAVSAVAFAADGKHLASAGKDATVLVWDLAAPAPKAAAAPPRPGPHCWQDLGTAHAALAFRAMTELVGAPEEAIALFRARLPAAAPVPADVIERLITGLGHEKYAVRERAAAELARLEGRARRYLVKALAGKVEGETAKRLHLLLDVLDGPARAPDDLRVRRAVEVLERIGTPAALELLDRWARGAPGARLTEDAEAARRRLRARLAGPSAATRRQE